MNFAAMNYGATELVRSLIDCTWPEYFFRKLLGLSPETIDKLPTLALWVVGVYLVFALAALGLKKWKGQKSHSDMMRKFVDCICIVAAILCLWLVPQLVAQGKTMGNAVAGQFAWTEAGITWLSHFMQAWFDPAVLIIILVAFSALPLFTMVRYVKAYKLWALVWVVYDTLFGAVIVAAAVLAMHHGDFKWYLLILPALALNLLGQRGGVIRDNAPEQGK